LQKLVLSFVVKSSDWYGHYEAATDRKTLRKNSPMFVQWRVAATSPGVFFASHFKEQLQIV